MGYLHNGPRASHLAQGFAPASPGFLLLLPTPQVLAVAQGGSSRALVKVAVIRFKLLPWASVKV